ncbi:MAG TPA: class I SAM-dependent methyltransferase [Thermoanaerobaculia bacterium]
MNDREHWDRVYTAKGPEQVSWYRPHLDRSLAFIEAARIDRDAAILDVGGGASTLVDDLLDRGFSNVAVLDLSRSALDAARRRLGPLAERARWICADVLEADLPPRSCDFWHDRAVFHFLRDPRARARYVEVVRRSLKPGGHVVVATFGPHGPEKCSGLEVLRFNSEQLLDEFGPDFAKIADATESHTTPWGAEQEFVYCYCRMPAARR